MQTIGDLFANNKILFVAILVVVLAVIGGVIAVASRALFGGRINAGAGGRSRQPRLGVVDAFDLDRQRQLVIVRRDNVEHLLMIGGPNDLVIETAIARAAPVAAPQPSRDKEAGSLPIAVPTTFAAPPMPVMPAPPMPPAVIVDPGSVVHGDGEAEDGPAPADPVLPAIHVPEIAAPPVPRAAPPVQAPPRLPATPFPPRPQLGSQGGAKPVFPPPRPVTAPPRPLTTPTRPSVAAAPLRPPVEAKRPDDAVRAVPQPPADDSAAAETPPVLMPTPVAPEPAPPPKPPLPPFRTARPDAARPEPSPPVRPAPPLNRAAPPPPAPTVQSLDALESLEEEMAKLLGRPVPPADKS